MGLPGHDDGFFHSFPPTGLLEERALLLGRMGKHEQALFIYVHVLKDTRMAEEYVDPAVPPPRGVKEALQRDERLRKPPLHLQLKRGHLVCWPPIVLSLGCSLRQHPCPLHVSLSDHSLPYRYCHKHYDQNKDGNKDVSSRPQGAHGHCTAPLSIASALWFGPQVHWQELLT